ncbi:hypothetical protein BMT54_01905 [Pasteurellaceae bacterium 15-036681]|nr:hypothetical protein BMT54_01905 [Pasteurellaceae bacterium 15-036681]
MSNLTILNTAIRTSENLFCLNDLHRIGGKERRHEPNLFTRLDQTKELIAEIQQDSTILAVKTIRGTQGGTYACEELALAYAMWISPKFHLVVLRAFIAMHKGEAQKTPQIEPLVTEQEFHHILKNSDAVGLGWLWFEAFNMVEFIGHITPALEAIGSSFAPRAHSMKFEYGRHIHKLGKLIYTLTKDADFGHNTAPKRTLESEFNPPKPKTKAVALRRAF